VELIVKRAFATVYVVDDDDGVRESLRALLEAHGFVVEDFSSSDDFIARYDGRPHGCLILDLHLPRSGGMVVLENLRKTIGTTLPVLLITGHGGRATRAFVLNAGADAYLDKPFDSDVLLVIVRDLLDRSLSTISP